MNVESRWRQGVQWGALVWLGWIVVISSVRACENRIELGDYFVQSIGWFSERAIVAMAWLMAMGLQWTRWSRPGIAVALLIQTVSCSLECYHGPGFVETSVIALYAGRCAPVVPLLFMVPERPRLTVALALVGRWRDALRSLGDASAWISVVAAAGIMVTSRDVDEAILIAGFDAVYTAFRFLPSALLLSIAAIGSSVYRRRARVRA